MQASTQCKSVQTYKSFSLVGNETKNHLPKGEQKTHPDTMEVVCPWCVTDMIDLKIGQEKK